MCGAEGCSRGASRLAAGKRRLLQAAALGALASPGALIGVDAAWGQISETLPEVRVSAPRPAPRPPRRAEPAPRRAAPSAPERPEPAPAPVPSVSAPSPFQFVAPTPITGLGIDRSKVPAMVQTLPAVSAVQTIGTPTTTVTTSIILTSQPETTGHSGTAYCRPITRKS